MEPIERLEDELGRGLDRLRERTPYAEVVVEERGGLALRHDRQATRVENSPMLQGAVLRAWDGAGWVESATSRYDADGIRGTVDQLRHRLATRRGEAPAPGRSAEGRGTAATSARRPVSGWGIEERRELARALFGWATGVEGIANATVVLSSSTNRRLFLNTAGAYRLQSVDRAHGAVVPIAMESGRVEFDYLTEGGTGGVERLDAISEARVVAAAKEAKALLSATAGPTGPTTVLLDPSTAGTFAHESFGHGTEADQILRHRSYLGPILGQQLGPEGLTLVDDGSRPGEWGSYFFDDEGFPTRRTVLVDRGRFVGVLHDRESAEAMHASPTGNCRRADFLSRPFVRMSNTLVEPGDWGLEELLREARQGVVLETCTSGIEDPLGGQMQIKVKKGHLIEGGERTRILPSMALSGRVLDVLRAVRGVGRAEYFQSSPGSCGKGHSDLLPAGTAGSYVLTEAIVGPA